MNTIHQMISVLIHLIRSCFPRHFFTKQQCVRLKTIFYFSGFEECKGKYCGEKCNEILNESRVFEEFLMNNPSDSSLNRKRSKNRQKFQIDSLFNTYKRIQFKNIQRLCYSSTTILFLFTLKYSTSDKRRRTLNIPTPKLDTLHDTSRTHAQVSANEWKFRIDLSQSEKISAQVAWSSQFWLKHRSVNTLFKAIRWKAN